MTIEKVENDARTFLDVLPFALMAHKNVFYREVNKSMIVKVLQCTIDLVLTREER